MDAESDLSAQTGVVVCPTWVRSGASGESRMSPGPAADVETGIPARSIAGGREADASGVGNAGSGQPAAGSTLDSSRSSGTVLIHSGRETYSSQFSSVDDGTPVGGRANGSGLGNAGPLQPAAGSALGSSRSSGTVLIHSGRETYSSQFSSVDDGMPGGGRVNGSGKGSSGSGLAAVGSALGSSRSSGTVLIHTGRETYSSQFSSVVDGVGTPAGDERGGSPPPSARRTLTRSADAALSSGAHGAVVDFRELFPWWRRRHGGQLASGDSPSTAATKSSSGLRLRLPALRLFRRPRDERPRVVDARDLFPWLGPAGPSGSGPVEIEGDRGEGDEGGKMDRDRGTSWGWVELWRRSAASWRACEVAGDGVSPVAPCCVGRGKVVDRAGGVPMELREDRQVGRPRLEFAPGGGSEADGGPGRGEEWRGRLNQLRHPVVVTPLFVAAAMVVFALMAGVYPLYELQRVHASVRPSMSAELLGNERWHPNDLSNWANNGQTFSFEFLVCWGGRFSPKVQEGEWWRWFTSPFVHQSFRHLAGNVVLLAALAGHLERDHGAWQVGVVFVLSSLGGNIMSAAFEDGCMLVLGASGAVFGFLGLFATDSVLNFDAVRRPLVRMGVILAFLAFFIVTVLNPKDGAVVSHFSHFGGLLVGLFPPFLFIPSLRRLGQKGAARLPVASGLLQDSRSGTPELHCPMVTRIPSFKVVAVRFCAFVGAMVLVVLFVALPVYLYTSKLSNTVCLAHARDLGGVVAQHP